MVVVSSKAPRRVVECALAVVLFLAASLKIYDALTNSNPIGINLPSSGRLIVLLVVSESLLGVWLLLGGFGYARFRCAIGAFTVFSIVAANEAVHSVSSCGCFGMVKVPPAITAIFDFSAIISLWLTRPRIAGAEERQWQPRNRLLNGTLASLIAAALLTFSYHLRSASAIASGTPVELDPTSWIHQEFPLFNSIEGADELKSGRWLLVLYHYDCDECRRVISAYQELAAMSAYHPHRMRVAFISIPPYAPSQWNTLDTSPGILWRNLRGDHEWIANTPVVVAVENGRVLAAADGNQAASPPDVPEWR